jgi:hypothetical protein
MKLKTNKTLTKRSRLRTKIKRIRNEIEIQKIKRIFFYMREKRRGKKKK